MLVACAVEMFLEVCFVLWVKTVIYVWGMFVKAAAELQKICEFARVRAEL